MQKIHVLIDTLFPVLKNKRCVQCTRKDNKGTFEFRRLLIVLPHGSAMKQLLRNVEGVEACEVCDLNAFEVTHARAILFTEQSLQELHTQFGLKTMSNTILIKPVMTEKALKRTMYMCFK